MKRQHSAFFLATASMALLGGCPLDPPDPPDPPPGPGATTCADLKVIYASSPKFVFSRPTNDTYGVNAYYIWEVEQTEGADGSVEYRFMTSGKKVGKAVPDRNWQGPKEDPTLWSALRWALDGLDPHVFTDEDPFTLGYLPYVGGTSWVSKNGARNDGTCPANNTTIGGWPRCVGTSQQDPLGPKTVEPGRFYLIRMMMLVVGGTDSSGRLLNRVQSCYQKLFTPTGWGPQQGIDPAPGVDAAEALAAEPVDLYGEAMSAAEEESLPPVDQDAVRDSQVSDYEI